MHSLSDALDAGLSEIKKKKEEYDKVYNELAGKVAQFRCVKCGKAWERKGSEVLSGIDVGERWSLEMLKVLGNKFEGVNNVICNECRDAVKRREKEEHFKNIIPAKYHNVELFAIRKRLLETHWNKNLFVTGGIGTGKTVFALAVAKKRAIEKDQRIWFISYPKLILKLQSTFNNKNGESAYELAEQAANFDGVLIIDDLGAEKTSEFVKEVTYYIINEREQNMRMLIVTSNLSLTEIKSQIDERISSRIAGMCEVVKISGDDYRKVKGV